MKHLIFLVPLIVACNPVQQATTDTPDTPDQQAEQPIQAPQAPLIERFEYAWQTVLIDETPPNAVYSTAPRDWSSLDYPQFYSAQLSYEKYGWHRLTLETQDGIAAYFINRETMIDGEALMLHKGSYNNPSGLRVSFDFLDDNTVALDFSIQVGLTVYPNKATLLVR